MSLLPINVVFASDNNFAKYTAVTLVSLLKNVSVDRPLKIIVLTDEVLDENNKKKILDLARFKDFELLNIVVDAVDFKNIRTTPGITLATYYRLVMHHLLPDDMERVIYLDSDLIIRKCISKLYDVELGNDLFAGVQDSRSIDYNRKFGLPDNVPHINAGVTVVNLKKVREIDLTKRINSYLEINRYRITLGDQQILNGEFHESIRYVPVAWNVHGSMFDQDWVKKHAGNLNSFSVTELAEAAKDPAIIHFTYKRKPWMSPEHPRADEWAKYARQTAYFKDFALAQPPGKKTTLPASREEQQLPAAAPLQKPASFFARVNGYIKSISELRHTRLRTNRIEYDLAAMDARVLELAKAPVSAPAPAPAPNPLMPYYLLEDQSASLLREISSSPKRDKFIASQYLADLPEYSRFFTNGEPKDLDGGFHENLKTILRTPDIRRNIDISETDAIVVLVQRLRQEFYWKALYQAKSYGKDILFAEASFFGAFAPYYDDAAPPVLRKAFGYILDDLGYYFDARNPSRLELYLNNPASTLSRTERARAKRLIKRVVSEGITKYNFSSTPAENISIPKDSVIIIDQKQGDASIEFAAATPKTFELMIEAAVRENPGSKIYLKAHPDNFGKIRHALDARVELLPSQASMTSLLDQCAKVYVVSSQVGFEAILRGKEVHVFGLPFYAGWGLTKDSQKLSRRTRALTVEDLFYAACIRHSIYVNPLTGKLIEIEAAFDLIADLRSRGDQRRSQIAAE